MWFTRRCLNNVPSGSHGPLLPREPQQAPMADMQAAVDSTVFPLSKIVGQEAIKSALLLGTVNSRIGGIAISGDASLAHTLFSDGEHVSIRVEARPRIFLWFLPTVSPGSTMYARSLRHQCRAQPCPALQHTFDHEPCLVVLAWRCAHACVDLQEAGAPPNRSWHARSTVSCRRSRSFPASIFLSPRTPRRLIHLPPLRSFCPRPPVLSRERDPRNFRVVIFPSCFLALWHVGFAYSL